MQFKNHYTAQSFNIDIDPCADERLTAFGKATLKDRYMTKSEVAQLEEGGTYQVVFARAASFFATSSDHAQRLYNYMSNLWFMPSTPILSNSGTDRGFPISCFLNAIDDTMSSILDTFTNNGWLACRGGGIGTYWGDVRSHGDTIGQNGEASGIIPFIKVMDSLTLAVSQGSLRRGSAAVYLPVWHPEIEEFINLRKPTGGDPNRKALNIHNAVCIDDAFMEAVRDGSQYALRSPKTNETMKMVDARTVWTRILEMRVETGEPYILFTDTVNNQRPAHHKELGLEVKQSNLCSEITLPTGIDHLGKNRTAVCCLSSVNVEYFPEWQTEPLFIRDIVEFLDNVLSYFIEAAAEAKGFESAVYSAKRERSIGLGVMGFHSYLQRNNMPFASPMAKGQNLMIWNHLAREGKAANQYLTESRGPCPDSAASQHPVRLSNIFSIAPTASISIICGNTSPCIEPIAANSFQQKTLSGSFTVRNKYLERTLRKKVPEGVNEDEWLTEQWSRINSDEGSVRNLTCLNEAEKEIFQTAYEVDQRAIIEMAADRAPMICQAQSTNLFLPSDVNKRDLHHLHFNAWRFGLKSLYYCRSKSVGRADKISNFAGELPQPIQQDQPVVIDYDSDCTYCQ